jgi:hypothetical protein
MCVVTLDHYNCLLNLPSARRLWNCTTILQRKCYWSSASHGGNLLRNARTAKTPDPERGRLTHILSAKFRQKTLAAPETQMDILLTADLHSKSRWFRWLESQAELIGIAGDLWDLFSSVDPKTQSIAATSFLRRLSTKTKVAVCSGNHDSIDYLANTCVAAPLWLSELNGIKNLIADGAN